MYRENFKDEKNGVVTELINAEANGLNLKVIDSDRALLELIKFDEVGDADLREQVLALRWFDQKAFTLVRVILGFEIMAMLVALVENKDEVLYFMALITFLNTLISVFVTRIAEIQKKLEFKKKLLDEFNLLLRECLEDRDRNFLKQMFVFLSVRIKLEKVFLGVKTDLNLNKDLVELFKNESVFSGLDKGILRNVMQLYQKYNVGGKLPVEKEISAKVRVRIEENLVGKTGLEEEKSDSRRDLEDEELVTLVHESRERARKNIKG